MMMGIGPGDVVICVDASDDPWGRPVPFERGNPYTVAEIFYLPHITDDMPPALCFELEGVPPGIHPETGEDVAWGAYRFRPIGLPPEPAKADLALADA